MIFFQDVETDLHDDDDGMPRVVSREILDERLDFRKSGQICRPGR